MPAMTPEELHKFLNEHFPQAAHLDLRIEHLDDTTIRVRLPTKEQHLRPGGTISGPSLVWLADFSFYLPKIFTASLRRATPRSWPSQSRPWQRRNCPARPWFARRR